MFEYQSIATNIPVRFNPAGTKVDHNVMGMTPRKSFRLFLNSPLLNENDEIIWEADGRRFRVTQVRSFFGHHYEAQAEET